MYFSGGSRLGIEGLPQAWLSTGGGWGGKVSPRSFNDLSREAGKEK